MLPTDRGAFAKLIARHLGAYAKSPTPDEIGMWFDQLERFTLDDIGRALESHEQHADDGKRAPRPIDVVRILRSGASGGDKCAVTGANGRCQFPGVFSESTNGGGPWFCSWHMTDRHGPEAERYISASHEITHEEALAKRVTRLNAESNQSPTVKKLREAMAARARRPAPGNIGDLAHAAAGVERQPGEDEAAA